MADAAHYAAELAATADRASDHVAELFETLADHGVDPDTALDAACGIGRHAVPMADRGVDVTGFDLSPGFVERARGRAADAGVADRTSFVEGDYRDPPVEEPFDLVTCLFTAVGYYDRQTDERVFAELRDRVAENGAFVVDVTNREGMLAHYQDSHVYEFGDFLCTEQRDYDPATAAMTSTRELFERDDGGLVHQTTFEYEMRMYSPVELAAMLRDAGFGAVTLYDGYDGGELERDTHRLVAVAEP